MKKLKSSFLSIYIATLVLLAGCAKQEQLQTMEKFCTPQIEKETAFETAREVLGKMHFSIDKADPDAGYIRTQPLEGAQFFELWRKDNVGDFNKLEANLHTLRRIAEIQVEEEQNEICIHCRVETQRLSLPESETGTVSLAYETFSTSQSSLQKFEVSDEQKQNMSWVKIGKDKKLATRILEYLQTELQENREGTQL